MSNRRLDLALELPKAWCAEVSARFPTTQVELESFFPVDSERMVERVRLDGERFEVTDSHIDVPDTPGLGVSFIPEEAKKYLREEDAGFFDD